MESRQVRFWNPLIKELKLWLQELENENGRLTKTRCYVEVPCYKSGGILENITCDD